MSWEDEPPKPGELNQQGGGWDSAPPRPEEVKRPVYQPGFWEQAAEGVKPVLNVMGRAFGTARQLQDVVTPGSGAPEGAMDFGTNVVNKGFEKAGEWTAEELAKKYPQHPYAAAGTGMAVANIPLVAAMAGPAAYRAIAPRLLRGRLATAARVPAAAAEIPVVEPVKAGEPYGLFSYNSDMNPEGQMRSMYTIYGDPEHPLIKQGEGLPGAGFTTQTLEWFKERGIPIKGREARTVGKWDPLDYPGAPAAAAAAVPAATPSAAPEPAPAGPPSLLERLGTKGINSHTGISPETVQAMTRSGQNPAEVGASIGKRLVEEKVVAQTPGETWAKASAKRTEYGEAVQKALDDIQQANRSLGVYPEMEDSLKIGSLKALKPLSDEYVARANSPFSANRRMARPWKEAYTYLADEANANGGFTTLDHVNGTLQKVGEMLGKLEKGTESYKNVARLYGTLANTRDAMVQDIASRVSNPALASNLVKANQGYSFFSRILPDLNWQAAADAVGGPEMSIMGTIKSEARPILSRAAVRAGTPSPSPRSTGRPLLRSALALFGSGGEQRR